MMPEQGWKPHVLHCGSEDEAFEEGEAPDASDYSRKVEPWLTALLQAEHANLLLGSGFPIAVANAAQADSAGMDRANFNASLVSYVDEAAKRSAEKMGRGKANIEDQIRSGRQLLDGLKVLAHAPAEPEKEGNGDEAEPGPEEASEASLGEADAAAFLESAAQLQGEWQSALNKALQDFMESILEGEENLLAKLEDPKEGHEARRLLASVLLTFSSRAGSRERLHLFTTNYDRLIEYGCDLLGLRVLDRFVGTLAPVFRSSRIGVDLHYNPPGIRGEPRYLEGVVRMTKLHGSVDWHYGAQGGQQEVIRRGIPFGADRTHPDLPAEPLDSLMIYPNPAKDVETLLYPYADLFRDFASATCQPNSVLFTYGYGFGDDHINRVIKDMLTIPSTHLAIISWDLAGDRIPRFLDKVGKPDQTTLLLGSVFGHLPNLVNHLLPKPAIDRTTWKMMELLRRRASPEQGRKQKSGPEDQEE